MKICASHCAPSVRHLCVAVCLTTPPPPSVLAPAISRRTSPRRCPGIVPHLSVDPRLRNDCRPLSGGQIPGVGRMPRREQLPFRMARDSSTLLSPPGGRGLTPGDHLEGMATSCHCSQLSVAVGRSAGLRFPPTPRQIKLLPKVDRVFG